MYVCGADRNSACRGRRASGGFGSFAGRYAGADVDRAEAVRAVKDLQHAYSQYAQFGLWNDLGSLFTENGEAIYADNDADHIKGRAAIAQYNMTKLAAESLACRPGINSLFVEVPIL